MSDVLGSRVVDADGTFVGRVVDIRLVQDGPYVDGFGAALRLDTLIIGRRGVPTRLGYLRGGIKGPALIRWAATRIERRARTVAWRDVAEVDDVVHLHARADELTSLREAVASW